MPSICTEMADLLCLLDETIRLETEVKRIVNSLRNRIGLRDVTGVHEFLSFERLRDTIEVEYALEYALRLVFKGPYKNLMYYHGAGQAAELAVSRRANLKTRSLLGKIRKSLPDITGVHEFLSFERLSDIIAVEHMHYDLYSNSIVFLLIRT